MWLSNVEQLYVRRCEYRDSRTGHEIVGDLLAGSHPMWEQRTLQVAEPVTPGQVVALLPHSAKPLGLSPLLTVAPCEQCRRDDLFVLDSLADSAALRARSMQDHEMTLSVADM